MTQKFTGEEVRATIAEFAEASFPREEIDLEKVHEMLTAYADTLNKPADSGQVGGMADLLADWRRAADAHDEIGFGAAADVGRTCARELEAALAAQGQGEAASPLVEFSVDFMDGWLEGESEEVLRNWKRVRQAATRPAPPAAPAGVPDGCIPVPRSLVERWASVDAFNAPVGAAMELKVIAGQMLLHAEVHAAHAAPESDA